MGPLTLTLLALLTGAALLLRLVRRRQREAREYLMHRDDWNERVMEFQRRRAAHKLARERLRQLHTRGGNGAA